MLAVVGYAGATTGAIGPAFGSVAEPVAATASITRSGDDVLITGSEASPRANGRRTFSAWSQAPSATTWMCGRM
jgi:hypothetical protein